MQSQSLLITGTIRFVLIPIMGTKLLLKRGTDWDKLGGGVTKMLDHYTGKNSKRISKYNKF